MERLVLLHARIVPHLHTVEKHSMGSVVDVCCRSYAMQRCKQMYPANARYCYRHFLCKSLYTGWVYRNLQVLCRRVHISRLHTHPCTCLWPRQCARLHTCSIMCLWAHMHIHMYCMSMLISEHSSMHVYMRMSIHMLMQTGCTQAAKDGLISQIEAKVST